MNLATVAQRWRREVRPTQLFFALYGFLPIACLSLALQGLAPLRLMAELLILPATGAALGVGVTRIRWGREAAAGLVSGIAAVAVYDAVRLAFVYGGAMPDPIPALGRMALGDPGASWVWGYAWRFVWNGGAMGIAFAMLPLRGPRAGAGFGLFVCGGLFATLAVSAEAQARFLELTPANVTIAIAGHLVYGGVLGWTLERLRHAVSPPRYAVDQPRLPRIVVDELPAPIVRAIGTLDEPLPQPPPDKVWVPLVRPGPRARDRR
jgi:hypothetical protein